MYTKKVCFYLGNNALSCATDLQNPLEPFGTPKKTFKREPLCNFSRFAPEVMYNIVQSEKKNKIIMVFHFYFFSN